MAHQTPIMEGVRAGAIVVHKKEAMTLTLLRGQLYVVARSREGARHHISQCSSGQLTTKSCCNGPRAP